MPETEREKRERRERREARDRRRDAERRSAKDRRIAASRRMEADRREAQKSRSGRERRSGADRRKRPDRRARSDRRSARDRRIIQNRRTDADRRAAKASETSDSKAGHGSAVSEGLKGHASASATEHRAAAKELGELNCAVVVVSDSRTESTDRSGNVAQELIERFGHKLVKRYLIKNDRESIAQKLHELTGAAANLVVFCGGTGLGRHDVTVETVTPLLDKVLDGFGEAFRRLSWDEIGAAAILSRAVAGSAAGSIVVCTPGSSAAVRLALEDIVLPELPHFVREANR